MNAEQSAFMIDLYQGGCYFRLNCAHLAGTVKCMLCCISHGFFPSGAGELIFAKNISFRLPITYQLSPYSPSFDLHHSPMVLHADEEHLKKTFTGQVTRSLTGYVVFALIGSHHYPVTLSFNTGSDLTWVQCKPCGQCYPKYNPVYNHTISSTFMNTMCEGQYCKIEADRVMRSCTDDRRCLFGHAYGDNKNVMGSLVSDYFEFQEMAGTKKIFHSRLTFGCAHSTVGNFNKEEDGVLGLGRGPFSLISQLAISAFSHCLPPPESYKTSYISFGDAAQTQGPGAYLILNKRYPSRYYLKLHSIALLDHQKKITLDGIPSNTFAFDDDGFGGFYLDMGTPFINLPQVAYHELRKVLDSTLLAYNIRPIGSSDPSGSCFEASFDDVQHISLVFTISLHDLILTGTQVFYENFDSKGVICLGVMESKSKETILGSFAQTSRNIGYDLENMMITFQDMEC
ncbi:aspartic proteinase nepenthesin-2-like isoform X2 [Dioscorea cayenensis subsp. rotundata]|nr:aspartic proteinase nepenthesin-2-like isoform X2 [Dioscorea cayenensis subsp. rotundata]XP_039143584.1 aspartic proteinase nepenthesin-2-like isoform X2 [Dioscorea cayenensis subsp. rotundata]XP_039143585.1 aspartic proteinase nepenthesin-2-like isoform X2 [Dioscorea cayenensis subsp. rotundata]